MTNTERDLRKAVTEQEQFMAERGGNFSGYIRFYEALPFDADRDENQRITADVYCADRDELRARWGALNRYLATQRGRRTPATRRMA